MKECSIVSGPLDVFSQALGHPWYLIRGPGFDSIPDLIPPASTEALLGHTSHIFTFQFQAVLHALLQLLSPCLRASGFIRSLPLRKKTWIMASLMDCAQSEHLCLNSSQTTKGCQVPLRPASVKNKIIIASISNAVITMQKVRLALKIILTFEIGSNSLHSLRK